MPFLIGGHGRRVVALAARYADIFQFTGLVHGEGGAPTPGGFGFADVRRGAEWLAADAGAATDGIERSALVQVPHVGPGADEAIAAIVERFGTTPELLAETPFVLVGSVEQVVDKLDRLRADARHLALRRARRRAVRSRRRRARRAVTAARAKLAPWTTCSTSSSSATGTSRPSRSIGPEKRNALALDVMTELTTAIEAIGTSDARGVVLAANGPVFSAGHNFGDMAGATYDEAPPRSSTCAPG